MHLSFPIHRLQLVKIFILPFHLTILIALEPQISNKVLEFQQLMILLFPHLKILELIQPQPSVLEFRYLLSISFLLFHIINFIRLQIVAK